MSGVRGQLHGQREPERAALPGSLSTPMVPPIAVTSWREMARPSPVPPNLRVVEESACENGVEQPLPVLGSDTDAGVGDLEPDDHALVGPVLELGAEHDLAVLGELHGVRGQVQQHLAQPGRVAAQTDRQLGRAVGEQLEALALRRIGDQLGGLLDDLRRG